MDGPPRRHRPFMVLHLLCRRSCGYHPPNLMEPDGAPMDPRTKSLVLALSLTLAAPLAATTAQTPPQRPLTPDDVYNLKTVRDPQVSPDGRWVAYTVERLDRDEDTLDRDVWMVPYAGGEPVRLTASPKSER